MNEGQLAPDLHGPFFPKDAERSMPVVALGQLPLL